MSLPEQAAILAGQLCLARNGHQYRDKDFPKLCNYSGVLHIQVGKVALL